MTNPQVAAGRRYGGADADERTRRRRQSLIESGVELFGTEGYASITVKRICDHAGLTQRYFYESFPDRTALLAAVYVDCVRVARESTLTSAAGLIDDGGPVPSERVPTAARTALGAFLRCLDEDPRLARIMLVEVVGVAPDIEQLRMRAIHGWAELILGIARGGAEIEAAQRLAAVGLVGAVTQLLVDWYTATHGAGYSDTSSPRAQDIAAVAGGSRPQVFDVEEMLDVCVDLFVATHAALWT